MSIRAFIVSCVVSLACGCCLYASEILQGKVVGVSDGDTIKVLDCQSVQHKIRLDRIDAPEKKQAYGEKAKQHLSELIFGREVKVEWQKKDRYQRILGIVYLEGKDINLQMVKDGFAWHYKHYDKTPEYAKAELDARKQKLGLWNDPNPIEPHLFRKGEKPKPRAKPERPWWNPDYVTRKIYALVLGFVTWLLYLLYKQLTKKRSRDGKQPVS